MPQTCKICANVERNEIEKAIALNESLRSIAKRFAISHASVNRHKLKCNQATLRDAQERVQLRRRAQNFSLADEIESFLTDAMTELKAIAIEARAAQDFRAAVQAVTEQKNTALQKWHLFSGQQDNTSTDFEKPLIVIEQVNQMTTVHPGQSDTHSLVKDASSAPKPVYPGSQVQ